MHNGRIAGTLMRASGLIAREKASLDWRDLSHFPAEEFDEAVSAARKYGAVVLLPQDVEPDLQDLVLDNCVALICSGYQPFVSVFRHKDIKDRTAVIPVGIRGDKMNAFSLDEGPEAFVEAIIDEYDTNYRLSHLESDVIL